MNVELKNVKHFEAGSEETSCFVATVYIDGVKAGIAQNDGHGGSTMFSPYTMQQKLDAYGATLPVKSEQLTAGEMFQYIQTGESIIDDLLTKYLIEKDLKKALARRMVYTKKNATGIYQTKVLPAADLQRLLFRPDIHEKWQIETILNVLPFSEALSIYSTAA